MRELELLDHIYRANNTLPGYVTLAPGDDMAGLRLTGQDVLVTVDQLADGVHVDLASTPLDKVARKAITRSLSDVAAMAAVPTAAVVAASLPRRFGDQQARHLFDALRAVAASFGCPLVGGDVSVWDHPLLLSVTILAQPAGVGPVTRQGAQEGDWVCVTGQIGGSQTCLNGYRHHLDFEPRLGVARRLAADPKLSLHSMIDLSDGLAIDLARLCHASATSAPLSAQLWLNKLPISPAAIAASRADGQPPWRHALGDGEDYELCFTMPALPNPTDLPTAVEGVAVTRVGVICAGDSQPAVTLRMNDGSVESVHQLGWEHSGD